jgi:UDP-N-acetylmuramoyl-tripeptide--D-alanyl-D-alanine ligase
MFDVKLNDFTQLSSAEFYGFPQNRKEAAGLCTDSRIIQNGEIFWALKGERFNGGHYLKDIAPKAAYAVIDAQFPKEDIPNGLPCIIVPDTLLALQEIAAVHRKKFQYPVIALTGSNGKTTTKEMIAEIISQKYPTHKTPGNYNNHIGCPLTLLGMTHLHEAAIVELGTSHPGEISTIAKLTKPDIALITNIGGAHLEFFSSESELAKEKLSLFNNVKRGGTIIINKDDKQVRHFNNDKLRAVKTSANSNADFFATDIKINKRGCASFRLNNTVDIQLSVPGVHNVSNAILAAAAASQLNFTLTECKKAIEKFSGFSRRMQMKTINGVWVVDDSYNANPVSMNAFIETAKFLPANGKKHLVFGDMFELGKTTVQKHQQIIKTALEANVGRLYFVGALFEAAANELTAAEKRKIIYNKEITNIFSALKTQLNKGDTLFIKGSRGMKMEQILEEI